VEVMVVAVLVVDFMEEVIAGVVVGSVEGVVIVGMVDSVVMVAALVVGSMEVVNVAVAVGAVKLMGADFIKN